MMSLGVLVFALIGLALGRSPVGPIVGGITEMTKDEIAKDGILKKAVDFAVAKYNEDVNGQ